MKKILFPALVIMLVATSSCVSAQNSSSKNTQSTLGNILSGMSSGNSSNDDSQSLLGSLLSGLIGNATTLTKENLVGTWNYSSPECRFESEKALAKAGGAIAANKVEEQLADLYPKIGVSAGKTSFTFNEDNSCVMVFNGRSIKGTYTFNSETRELAIRSNTGLIKLNAQLYYDFSSLAMMFEADKLLNIAKALSTFAGSASTTMSTLSALINNYDGMMVGFNLKK